MRIGLDVDDTITRCPAFFALISEALMAAGHQVYIITYRMDRAEVEGELGEQGVVFEDIILATDEELDVLGLYGWKAEVCRRLEIDIFFEDMPEIINELDPSVVAFMPFDPDLGKVTYVESEEEQQVQVEAWAVGPGCHALAKRGHA